MEALFSSLVSLYAFLGLVASLRAGAKRPPHVIFKLAAGLGILVLFVCISYILWFAIPFAGISSILKIGVEFVLVAFPLAVRYYFK